MTMITPDFRLTARRHAKAMVAAGLLACAVAAHAQPAPPPAAAVVAPRTSAPAAELLNIAGLAWLEGCWTGTVNQRDFREQWSPVRGSMLLGAGSTVYQGKTQNYEYLRIESRPDGIYYVALPSGQSETAFKLSAIDTDDKDTIFVFANPANDFPQRISYRRGTGGWLYATIDGKIKGEDKQVIFPMRRVGCESGEYIHK
jgi:Domain of unknown function (DUF6265)